MATAAPAAGKGKRKRHLSEDDVYVLLHKYAPGTILTALQEVAQHAKGRRIDWKAMVGKSTTGINSAREYQMLWRHFAYNHVLEEGIDAGAQPMGDDSDLELEPEPIPNPTKEALSEASALAKALISGSSREQASGHRVNLDVPVLNTPSEKIVRIPSEKQLAQSHRITDGTGPISNSKQSSHIGPSPGHLDPNGASKKRKKPKAWSKEEDAELSAGVQKYGEGNWEDILHKCNIDNTRTPDQLSQRWALISKRLGGSTKPASTKHTSVGSEERSAALKALSLAVGPMRALSAQRSGAFQQSIQHKPAAFAPKMPEVRPAAAPPPAPALALAVPAMPTRLAAQVQSPVHQGQQAPAQAAPPLKFSNASNKTRKKQAAQPNPTINPSSIQAAAIAAGGRLAPASTAANFLKVAQSKSAVHIRSSGGSGSSKFSACSKASLMFEHGTQPGGSQHLEPLNAITLKSGVSGVTAVNQSGPPAGVRSLETKKALSTTIAPVPCDSEEKDDDSNFCAITIDDLFPEDAKQPEIVDAKQPETVDTKAKQLETVDTKAKQPETTDTKAKQLENTDAKAMQPETMDPKSKQPDILDPKVEMVDPKDKDMLEFDQFVASQGHLNRDDLNKSKSAKSASQTQGLVGSQKKPLKLTPAAGKANPVTAGVTGKKAKAPVLHLAAGTPRGIVDTVNANAPNKTLARRAATPAPAPAGCQVPLKKDAVNAKGNPMTRSNSTVVSSGVSPVSSQIGLAAKGASKANPPSSSSQAKPNSVAVNGANRVVNPQSSNQASAAVNDANRAAIPPSSSQPNRAANPPSSSQPNRAANPPSSSQASTAMNGAVNKGNPPAAGGQ